MAEDRQYIQEYIRQGEPQEQEHGRSWRTVIGLQEGDNLKTSPYSLETNRRHIEGDITISETLESERTVKIIIARLTEKGIIKRSKGKVREAIG